MTKLHLVALALLVPGLAQGLYLPAAGNDVHDKRVSPARAVTCTATDDQLAGLATDSQGLVRTPRL